MLNILKRKKVDATQGSLIKMIVLYTIPLIFSALIQTLFNAVDIVVLGNMADSTAVASVGATSSIVSLIVNSFIGIATGTRVILARQVGAGDPDNVQKTVDTSLITAVLIGLIVGIVGFIWAPDFLHLTKCPEDCFNGALLYIRIYICSAPAVLLYNFGSAVLNETGDTQRPMYYIVACGLLNVVLNVIFCLILPQKVAAVAIATAAAQILGAVLVMGRLVRMQGMGHVSVQKMRWNLTAFKKIMLYGLPIALQQALYPLANLQIQTAVNSFGVAAIAGSSSSSTIDGVPSAIVSSFGKTSTTFIGQNIGAEKPDRVKKSFLYCIALAVISGAVVGTAIYLSGRFWLSFILPDDPAAVEYAIIRMGFVTLFYWIAGANTVLSHSLQAFGYSIFCTVNSIFFVFCFRFIWMTWIYPMYETFPMLMACFLVSWALMMLVNIAVFTVVFIRYFKGKYKRI